MKNGHNNTNDWTFTNATEFWTDTYRPYIKTVYFDDDISNMPTNCTASNLCWDISENENQSKKVYGYLVDSGEKDDNSNILYDLNIVSEAPIFAPSSCESMFRGFNNLISFNFNNFNTSNVTNMSNMFWNCRSLTNLDLSRFNTSSVTTMKYMFYNCSSLKSINLSSFNTSNVTDMSSMFCYCSSLVSLDVSSFNTSKVTSMGAMFNGCSALIELDLSNFDTSKVTDMSSMFDNCSSLKSINLSSFNTSNVTGMSSMFSYCSSLVSLDVSSFNTSNVTDMGGMFNGCSALIELDLSNFNTSKVTDMFYMFEYCSSLTTEINIMSIGVKNYNGMFYYAATASGANITVNYIESASTLVDSMIATKSTGGNVVKGSVIPEYTITISGNDDITYEGPTTSKGTNITLTSTSGDYYVTSFKINGTLIEGDTFTMPNGNVTITDIVVVACTTFQTDHNPYLNDQSNVIIGEKTFEGATSLTVILDYQTENAIYDYFYIYDSASSTTGINNNKKYGGSTRTKETITINGNYIKITFTSDSSANDYYGLKATIIPNY